MARWTWKSFLKETFLSTSIILLGIPLTGLFLVFILFVAIPAKLWTRFVSYVAYLTDPDINKIVTGLPAAQIRDIDTIHTKPCAVVVTKLRLNGRLKFESLIKRFQDEVLIKLDSEKAYPTLQYPELQQYFHRFMGYVFLKWDRKFDVRNHFSVFNANSDKPVTRPELIKIWESLMSKPFPRERSPWEFVAVDNYKPDPSELEQWRKADKPKPPTNQDDYHVIFLRMHHGLGDGFVVSRLLGYISIDDFVPHFPFKISSLQRFFMNLRALTLGPYDALNWLIRYNEDYNVLHRPPPEQSHETFLAETDLIPAQRVKMLKEKFGVPFTVILTAVISGGLRKYFINYKKPIPKVMNTAIPIATSDHSDTISNEFTLASVGLGVHSDDPKERIDYVHKQMKMLQSSSWTTVANFLIDILGSLPMVLLQKATEKAPYGSTYSTLPGPKNSLRVLGSTLLEVNFSNGSNVDSPCYGLGTLTYDDHLRIIFFVDKNVIETRKETEDVIKYISEEFDVLERYQERRSSFELFPEAGLHLD